MDYKNGFWIWFFSGNFEELSFDMRENTLPIR